MANLKLEDCYLGCHIRTATENAKQIAEAKKQTVEFDFNDRTCIVNDKTVIDWFERDFMNSFIMGWKTIGPDCPMEYDIDIEIELRTKQLAWAQEKKQRLINQDIADQKERKKVDLLVKDIFFSILPGKEDEYAAHLKKNSIDGYSRAVVDYSEYWGRLMQKEISAGKPLEEIADSTQTNLGFLGISGFQYGCAVSILAEVWVHGAALKIWHNKRYGVTDKAKGVVNPAIMSISF